MIIILERFLESRRRSCPPFRALSSSSFSHRVKPILFACSEPARRVVFHTASLAHVIRVVPRKIPEENNTSCKPVRKSKIIPASSPACQIILYPVSCTLCPLPLSETQNSRVYHVYFPFFFPLSYLLHTHGTNSWEESTLACHYRFLLQGMT